MVSTAVSALFPVPTFGELAGAGGCASLHAMVPGRLAWDVRAAVWVMAAAAATAQLIDFGVYQQRLRLLDMTTHRSIFGVVSLGVLAVAACGCVLLAMSQESRRRRRTALSAILAFLLVLRIAQPPHVLLLSLPASAAALVLLWVVLPPGPARRLVREGCIVLVVAFAMHGVGEKLVAELGYGPATWAYQIKAVVKHSGELAGWAVVACGLVLALPRQVFAVRGAAMQEST